MRRKHWLLGLAAGALVASGVLAQDSILEDAQGRFTVPLPNGWTSETRADGVIVMTEPDGKLSAYALALPGDDLQASIESAWPMFFPNNPYDAKAVQVQDVPGSSGVEAVKVVTLLDMPNAAIYQVVGQQKDGISYLLAFGGDIPTAQRRGAQVNIIASGFTITSVERLSLEGVQPAPWTEGMSAELDAFVAEGLEKLEVPGLALAVVQDGEIVYAQGYGRRNDAGDPVTPRTQFMIGSTSKTFTVTLLAQLVDEGIIAWDTPIVDILPSFRVADAELSQTLTVQNLVCACTGVPRRDYELITNTLTPQDIIDSLATFEFFTDFGEAFQYSNQMVAMGGYVAALAEGAEVDEVLDTYAAQLQARIFEPLGMKASAVGTQAALTDDVALPYGAQLPDQYVEMPIRGEYFVDPLAPSGGLWSNVLDMGAYMAAWMNGGEALVSAEQRDLMWTPQVPISAQASYGLGWILSQYKNQRMIGHGGNTIGFTSTFEFLPEARLGVVVLANGRGANPLTDVVAARVFELAFGLESELLDSFDNTVKQAEEILANFNGTTEIDVEAVADYLGTWSNDFLGEVTFSLDDEGLLIGDVGEFRSVMMIATDAASGITSYIFRDPPIAGAGFTFERNEDGTPIIYIDKGSAQEYAFSKQD